MSVKIKPFYLITGLVVLCLLSIAMFFTMAKSSNEIDIHSGAAVDISSSRRVGDRVTTKDVGQGVDKRKVKALLNQENKNNENAVNAYLSTDKGQQFGGTYIKKPYVEGKPISELIKDSDPGKKVQNGDVCVICQGAGLDKQAVQQMIVDAMLSMKLVKDDDLKQLLLDGNTPFTINGKTPYLLNDMLIDSDKKPIESNGHFLKFKNGSIVGDDDLVLKGLDGTIVNGKGAHLLTRGLKKSDLMKGFTINGGDAHLDKNNQVRDADGNPVLDDNGNAIFWDEDKGFVDSSGDSSALKEGVVKLSPKESDSLTPKIDGKATYVDDAGVLHYEDGSVVLGEDGKPLHWDAKLGAVNSSGKVEDISARIGKKGPVVGGKETYIGNDGLLHFSDGSVVRDKDGSPVHVSSSGLLTDGAGNPITASNLSAHGMDGPLINGKQTYRDSNGILHFSDGSIVKASDGSPIHMSEDGTLTNGHGDALKLEDIGASGPTIDGKVTYRGDDGLLHYSDGSLVLDRNGKPVHISENGTLTDAEGNQVSLDSIPKERTDMELHNKGLGPVIAGKATFVGDDGLLHYADGSLVKDKDGKSIKLSKNGQLINTDGKAIPLDEIGASGPIINGESTYRGQDGLLHYADGSVVLGNDGKPLHMNESGLITDSTGEPVNLSDIPEKTDFSNGSFEKGPVVNGQSTFVGDDGLLHYADGSFVLDKNGNTLHANEDGTLTNSNGEKISVNDIPKNKTQMELHNKGLGPVIGGKATFVGDDGVLHYADGSLVKDKDGKSIKLSKNGQLINADGRAIPLDEIGASGPIINGESTYRGEDGLLHYADGSVVLGKDGNPLHMNESGLITDSSGMPVNITDIPKKKKLSDILTSTTGPTVNGRSTFVGKDGLLHYADGSFVMSKNGKKVKIGRNGELMDENGERLSLESIGATGPLVNGKQTYRGSDGLLHYADGSVVLDKSGKPIHMSNAGALTDSDGNPINLDSLNEKTVKTPGPLVNGKATYRGADGLLHYKNGTLVLGKNGKPIQISESGKLTDSDGNPVSMSSLGASGPVVNGKATYRGKDGLLHYSDGSLVLGKNGKPLHISKYGEISDSDGHSVNLEDIPKDDSSDLSGNAAILSNKIVDGTTEDSLNRVKITTQKIPNTLKDETAIVRKDSKEGISSAEKKNIISKNDIQTFKSGNFILANGNVLSLDHEPLLYKNRKFKVFQGTDGKFISDNKALSFDGIKFNSEDKSIDKFFTTEKTNKKFDFKGVEIKDIKDGSYSIKQDGQLYIGNSKALFNGKLVFVNTKTGALSDARGLSIYAYDKSGVKHQLFIAENLRLEVTGLSDEKSDTLVAGLLSNSDYIAVDSIGSKLKYKKGVYSKLDPIDLKQDVGVLPNGLLIRKGKAVYNEVGHKIRLIPNEATLSFVDYQTNTPYKNSSIHVVSSEDFKWYFKGKETTKENITVYDMIGSVVTLFEETKFELLGSDLLSSEVGHLYKKGSNDALLLDESLNPYNFNNGKLYDSTGKSYKAKSDIYVDNNNNLINLDGNPIFYNGYPLSYDAGMFVANGNSYKQDIIKSYNLMPKYINNKFLEPSIESTIDNLFVSSKGFLYKNGKVITSTLGSSLLVDKDGQLTSNDPKPGFLDASRSNTYAITDFNGIIKSTKTDSLIVMDGYVLLDKNIKNRENRLSISGKLVAYPLMSFRGFETQFYTNSKSLSLNKNLRKKLIGDIYTDKGTLVDKDGNLIKINGKSATLKGNKIIDAHSGRQIETDSGKLFYREGSGLIDSYQNKARTGEVTSSIGDYFSSDGKKISTKGLTSSNILSFKKNNSGDLFTGDSKPVSVGGKQVGISNGFLTSEGNRLADNGDYIKVDKDGTLTTNDQSLDKKFTSEGVLVNSNTNVPLNRVDQASLINKAVNGIEGLVDAGNTAALNINKAIQAKVGRSLVDNASISRSVREGQGGSRHANSESKKNTDDQSNDNKLVIKDYEPLLPNDNAIIADKSVLDLETLGRHDRIVAQLALVDSAISETWATSHLDSDLTTSSTSTNGTTSSGGKSLNDAFSSLNKNTRSSKSTSSRSNTSAGSKDGGNNGQTGPGGNQLNAAFNGMNSSSNPSSDSKTGSKKGGMEAAQISKAEDDVVRVLTRGQTLLTYVEIPYSSYGSSVLPMMRITGGQFSGSTITPSHIEEMSQDLLLQFDKITLPDGRTIKTSKPFATSINAEKKMAGSGAIVDSHYWEKMSIILPYSMISKAGEVIDDASTTTTTDDDTDETTTETASVTGTDLLFVLAGAAADEAEPIFTQKLESLVTEYKLLQNQRITVQVTSDVYIRESELD